MFNPTDTPGASAALSAGVGAPGSVAFGPESHNLVDLDAAITRLEAAERLARQVEAERLQAFAALDRVARREAATELGSGARERAAEDSLAYRAARAEAAAALLLSEQAVDRRLAQAAALSVSYAATLQAIHAGVISALHASVIVDAGRVIGPAGPAEAPDTDGLSPTEVAALEEVAVQRATYEALVLAHAVTMTPHRLRPIARQIAETFAEENLDTRHEQATQLRSVWVTDREDGMAELGALLPAHAAYAVEGVRWSV